MSSGSIRRSFLIASAERYLCAAITLISLTITARLMAPAEIGVAALSAGMVAIIETLREFGGATYLVQHYTLERRHIRTAFTIMLGSALCLMGALWVMAEVIASFFGNDAIAGYLHIAVFGILFGPFISTSSAMFRRQLEFGKLAILNICALLVQTATVIGLALLGFGAISFAWAGLAAGLSSVLLLFVLGADFMNFRIRLVEWRESFRFAAYDSMAVLLNQLWEFFPSLVFGRLLGVEAVGVYSRAVSVCQWPERVLFAALRPVLLPVFASGVREGRSTKELYLMSIKYITVLQWPALLMLVLLADPVVRLLLGDQWLETVPLVRLLAVAMLFWFPSYLTYPTLVAAGAIRDSLSASLIALPISGLILIAVAPYGLTSVALSMVVIMPMQVGVALAFVRRHIQFSLREFVGALRNSLLVTIISMIGPAFFLLVNGIRLEFTLLEAVVHAASGMVGWFVGVFWCRHPIVEELGRAKTIFVERLGRREDKSKGRPDSITL